ncbi:MAG TPA: lipopolysaccharide biosynthesis protein [Actinotalea sp.]
MTSTDVLATRRPVASAAARFGADALTNTFGRNLQFLVTLLTIPLIARSLGPQEFGLYGLSTAAYFFGSSIVDGGLSTALAGRVATSSPAAFLVLRRQYLGVRGLLFAVVLLSGVGVLIAPWWLYVWIGLCAGGISSTGEEWVLVARGHFASVVAMQWAGRLTYLAALVGGMAWQASPAVPAVCLSLGGAVTSWLSWRRVGWSRRSHGPIAMRSSQAPSGERVPGVAALLRLGAPALVARALSASYGQSSTLLVSAGVAGAALGTYTAADRAVRALLGVVDSLVITMLPRMVRAWAAGAAQRRAVLLLTLASVATGGALAGALYVSAPVVVALLYGHGFAATTAVLRTAVWIIPSACVTSMLTTNVLMLKQRTGAVLVVYTVGAAAACAGLFSLAGGATATTVASRLVLAEAAAAATALALCLRRRSTRSGRRETEER